MSDVLSYVPFAVTAILAAWLAVVGLLRWDVPKWLIIVVACLLVAMQLPDRVLSDRRLQAEQVRLVTEFGKAVRATTDDVPAPEIASIGAISIAAPNDGAEVHSQTIVEVRWQGSGTPWVVVNPAGSANFWVQPELENEGGGLWRGKIYLGEPGVGLAGARYFIAAVSGVEGGLKVGEVYSDWPEAEAASDVTMLVRK